MATKLELHLHQNLTKKQREILRRNPPYAILKGPAGTSKTYLALALGIQCLLSKAVAEIVVIRSAVEARSIGFLPGDVEGKLEPYSVPYIELIDSLSPKKPYRVMKSAKEIDFESTSFLRGRTFENTFMILDEFQNCNAHEIETVMTRVGEGSRLILCGDSGQSDLKGSEARERARAHARSDREHARVCDLRVHARRHRSFEIREEFLRRARGR
jgi:phosphate starvation-inducible PhoH-like protein